MSAKADNFDFIKTSKEVFDAAENIDEKRIEILRAAKNANTDRAMEGAVNHFTKEFGRTIPCSSDDMSDYLITFAGHLSIATLEQRKVLIGQYHLMKGFKENPSDSDIVRQTMKGIRVKYNKAQDQAASADMDLIVQTISHLDNIIATGNNQVNEKNSRIKGIVLQAIRNKALLLTSFWFGLRSDELLGIRFVDLKFFEKKTQPYFELFIPRAKNDREAKGNTKKLDQMDELCAMTALQDWISACSKGLDHQSSKNLGEYDSIFVKVTAYGTIQTSPMHKNSINKLLKKMFMDAGVNEERLSSHSMRHGVANWLTGSGATMKEVQDWIGWKDSRSAMRYQRGKESLPSIIVKKKQRENKLLEIERLLIEKVDSN